MTYPQQFGADPRAAFTSRAATAVPGGERIPFIRHGKHKFALSEFKMIATEGSGSAPMARMVVLETSNPEEHPVGSVVERQWHINAAAKFQGDKGDRVWGELVNFASALFGGVDVSTTKGREDVLGWVFDALVRDQQNPVEHCLRGRVVDCVATFHPSRQSKKPGAAPGEMTKEFTRDVYAAPQPPQDQGSVAAARAHVEHALANPPAPVYRAPAQQAYAPPPVANPYAPPPASAQPAWGGQPAPTSAPHANPYAPSPGPQAGYAPPQGPQASPYTWPGAPQAPGPQASPPGIAPPPPGAAKPPWMP